MTSGGIQLTLVEFRPVSVPAIITLGHVPGLNVGGSTSLSNKKKYQLVFTEVKIECNDIKRITYSSKSRSQN